MADINEEIKTVTIKKWDRAYSVQVDNTHNKLPSITFNIETGRTEDGENYSSEHKGTIQVQFDVNENYPLLNPTDDSLIDATGGNHSILHAHLYSLFKYKAAQIAE